MQKKKQKKKNMARACTDLVCNVAYTLKASLSISVTLVTSTYGFALFPRYGPWVAMRTVD